jgi:hypothetical protein
MTAPVLSVCNRQGGAVGEKRTVELFRGVIVHGIFSIGKNEAIFCQTLKNGR